METGQVNGNKIYGGMKIRSMDGRKDFLTDRSNDVICWLLVLDYTL